MLFLRETLSGKNNDLPVLLGNIGKVNLQKKPRITGFLRAILMQFPEHFLITPRAFLAVLVTNDKAQHDLVGIIGIVS